MGDMNVLDVVMRWLHIAGAIVAVGGSVFALAALIPALEIVSEEPRRSLHEEVRRRFVKLFLIAMAALLVSGGYNYLVNEIPDHRGQGLYHGLMGLKILLAVAVFFLGSALLGRSRAFEGFRRARRRWIGINVAAALVVVALGAVLSKIAEVPLAAE